MAYILSKVGQSFNVPVHIYEADTEEDMNSINLQSVPMGSKCHIINDDKWYMLNSKGEWKIMPSGGGTGAQWQPDQLTDEELLQVMIDTDTLAAVHDSVGILTDESGKIILW